MAGAALWGPARGQDQQQPPAPRAAPVFPGFQPRPFPPGTNPSQQAPPATNPPAANSQAAPGANPQTTPAPVPPPTVYGGLALNNASLTEVIDLLARQLKINYILDPRVKGGVILNTYGETKDIDTRSLLEAILRINGFGMVKQGDLYRIVPLTDISHLPIPPETKTDSNSIPEDDRTMLNLVFLKYISADELEKVLDPFQGENARIYVYGPANLLLILDSHRSMRRLMDLVAMFDSDQLVNQRVRVFDVKNGRPTDIAKELENISKAMSLSSKESPLKFLAIDRINTIIAVAPNPGAFREVESWLAKLDVPIKPSAGGVKDLCTGCTTETLPPWRAPFKRFTANWRGLAAPTVIRAAKVPFKPASETAGQAPPIPLTGAAPWDRAALGASAATEEEAAELLAAEPMGAERMAAERMAAQAMAEGTERPHTAEDMADTPVSMGPGPGHLPALPQQPVELPPRVPPRVPAISREPISGNAALGAFGPNRGPRVVANPINNTLLIQASEQEYEDILQLIKELDIPPRQVLIEAKIYSIDLTHAFSSDVTAALQTLAGTTAGTSTGTTAITSTAASLLASLAGGGVTLTGSALVGKSRALSGVVSLMESENNAKILSTPSIIATDSIAASINVGTTIPTLQGSVDQRYRGSRDPILR